MDIQSAEMVRVDGPMHPDLFGGESPTYEMKPLKETGRLFEVTVYFTGSKSTYVLAKNADEAQDAVEDSGDTCRHDFEDLEIESIRPREVKPGTPEHMHYAQRADLVADFRRREGLDA